MPDAFDTVAPPARIRVPYLPALRWCATALLLVAVAAFVTLSWRWRVVNDAALMHSVVLMAERGMTPYRVVRDINFPGAYVPDWAALQAAGTGWRGDRAWRIYDLGMLAAAAAAMVWIALPVDWFAGVFAGALFALYHGRDGIGQAGQRDLALAVLLLVGAASFLSALRAAERAATDAGRRTRAGRPAAACWKAIALLAACGLALGAATTVKPFAPLLFAPLLLWTALALRRNGLRVGGPLCAASVGFLAPLAAASGYLAHIHAVGDFVWMCRRQLSFHARLGHLPPGAMLRAASPWSLLELGGLALAAAVARAAWGERVPGTRESRLALLGVAVGLACFFVQMKGYPYQRYPYMVFLLLWVGVECARAFEQRRAGLRAAGAAGLVFGMLLAPSCLSAIAHARWQEPSLEAMEQDLRGLEAAGPGPLDGRVQCVDSISGCLNVLYRMGLTQATGTLYDEFLFPPRRLKGSPLSEAVGEGRTAFESAIALRPPEVILVASWLFPEGPGEYEKLDEWPRFRDLLEREYRLVDDRSFARGENGPLGFRVYVRR